MSPRLGRLGGCFISAVCVAGSAQAFAPGDVASTYQNGRVSNTWSHLAAPVTSTSSPTGVTVSKSFTLAGPGGRSSAAIATAALTRQSALLVVARSLTPLGLALGVGTLAWQVYDEHRIAPAGAVGIGGGELALDVGQSTTMQTVFSCAFGPAAATGSSAASACGAAVSKHNALFPNATCNSNSCELVTHQLGAAFSVPWAGYSVQRTTVTWCRAGYTNCGQGTTVQASVAGIGASATTAQACPAYVDFFNSANSVPAGSAPGPDGKCRTGTYTQPISAELAAQMVAASGTAANLDYSALLDDAIGRSPQTMPPGATIEAPAVVVPLVGPTVTTVNPDMSTTTEATGWNWSRDPINKAEGNWTEVKTKTERNASGVITATTSTSTTQPAPVPGDVRDPCVADPGRVGCLGLGVVADSVVGARDIPVAFTPDTGWGGSSATCPAPSTLNLSFGVFVFDNTLLCRFLGAIKFILLAISGLAAARIFLGGFQS